jgi:hypothetical protein
MRAFAFGGGHGAEDAFVGRGVSVVKETVGSASEFLILDEVVIRESRERSERGLLVLPDQPGQLAIEVKVGTVAAQEGRAVELVVEDRAVLEGEVEADRGIVGDHARRAHQ